MLVTVERLLPGITRQSLILSNNNPDQSVNAVNSGSKRRTYIYPTHNLGYNRRDAAVPGRVAASMRQVPSERSAVLHHALVDFISEVLVGDRCKLRGM